MALPSSGQMSMSQVIDEVTGSGHGSGPYSLKNLSNGSVAALNTSSTSAPNASSPYQMSEFYSYNRSQCPTPAGDSEAGPFDVLVGGKHHAQYDVTVTPGSGLGAGSSTRIIASTVHNPAGATPANSGISHNLDVGWMGVDPTLYVWAQHVNNVGIAGTALELSASPFTP